MQVALLSVLRVVKLGTAKLARPETVTVLNDMCLMRPAGFAIRVSVGAKWTIITPW